MSHEGDEMQPDSQITVSRDEKGLLPGRYALSDATFRLYLGNRQDARNAFSVSLDGPLELIVAPENKYPPVGSWLLNGRMYEIKGVTLDFEWCGWRHQCEEIKYGNAGTTAYFYLFREDANRWVRIAVHGLPEV